MSIAWRTQICNDIELHRHEKNMRLHQAIALSNYVRNRDREEKELEKSVDEYMKETLSHGQP